MLVSIGKREPREDPIELLIECHQRIRKFLEMARLVAVTALEPAEIVEVAGQIRRYFAESLPMHVADEQELLRPHLLGLSPELDAALATMDAEHAAMEPLLARLIAICDELTQRPAEKAAVARELTTLVHKLEYMFEKHLACEEREIFPAVIELSAFAKRSILLAIRERRSRALDEHASAARYR